MRLIPFVAVLVSLAAAEPSRHVAQASPSGVHPSLSGTWAPVDPQKADTFFSVGLSLLPGNGRLTIDQQAGRIAVTIALPADKLDVRLRLTTGRFYATVVYLPLEGRVGGYGTGGAPILLGPTWIGDRFIVPDATPGSPHPVTMSYSLKGDLLQVEETVTPSTVTQLLKKAAGPRAE